MFNILSRISQLEWNKADKWQINALESQVKTLQELAIQAGLVEKYVSPLEKGTTMFRLNEELYTVKKGK